MLIRSYALAAALACGCAHSHGDPPDDAALNVNSAKPEALLARVCAFVHDEPLCNDVDQARAFIQLLNTLRNSSPTALFSSTDELLGFIEGDKNRSSAYADAVQFLGTDSPLLAWTPIVIPADVRADIAITLRA